jgi:putative acetyltransferase
VHRRAFGKEAEARLVRLIRASERFVPELSLVAEEEGRIVGHVLLSYVDLDGGRVLSLAPMGVLPEFQRRGIGGQLIRAALDAARDLGEDLVVLVGHPDYYPRFGFTRARTLGIEPPADFPDDAWMAIRLAPGPGRRGRVSYPPAFAEVTEPPRID